MDSQSKIFIYATDANVPTLRSQIVATSAGYRPIGSLIFQTLPTGAWERPHFLARLSGKSDSDAMPAIEPTTHPKMPAERWPDDNAGQRHDSELQPHPQKGTRPDSRLIYYSES
tara:strand:- start:23 stop:364 length:342 start_codon:yes stop_codon:yes gene_type:complete